MQSAKHILLVTTRADLAADLLVVELRKRGKTFLRLNCEDFPTTVSMSWAPANSERILAVRGQARSLDSFQSAWYRRAVPPILPPAVASTGVGEFVSCERNSFLDGFWETAGLFWINRPANVRMAENKLTQLDLAKGLGLAIPSTVITNDPARARDFIASRPAAIAKPISRSALPGDTRPSVIFSTPVGPQDIPDDRAVQIAPFILQERIEKKLDFRLTLVGWHAFGTEILADKAAGDAADWRALPEQLLTYRICQPPHEILDLSLQMCRRLGLTYAAFDFLLTPRGEYVFLEVNPSGQWGWIEHHTGHQITAALATLLSDGRA